MCNVQHSAARERADFPDESRGIEIALGVLKEIVMKNPLSILAVLALLPSAALADEESQPTATAQSTQTSTTAAPTLKQPVYRSPLARTEASENPDASGLL